MSLPHLSKYATYKDYFDLKAIKNQQMQEEFFSPLPYPFLPKNRLKISPVKAVPGRGEQLLPLERERQHQETKSA